MWNFIVEDRRGPLAATTLDARGVDRELAILWSHNRRRGPELARWLLCVDSSPDCPYKEGEILDPEAR